MFESIALPIFITLGGWSTHFKPTYDYCTHYKHESICTKKKFNYNHNMIMVDVDGYTLGQFKNSYFSKSYMTGYTHRIDNFSIMAGIATGYQGNRCELSMGKYCAIISLSYLIKPLKFTLLGEAVAVAFEFEF